MIEHKKIAGKTMGNFLIRSATADDTGLIYFFIKKLAEYEGMLCDVAATEESLRHSMFELGAAEAIIGEEDGKPVGFALFFHNFSTFQGLRGLYLEDIFVLPEARGKGYGKTMLVWLAKLALQRGCGRFEWACLNWNEPSIGFYRSLGAKPMSDWTVFRLTSEAISQLADSAN
jgi:GNAT superfamily N-acetyltransferase